MFTIENTPVTSAPTQAPSPGTSVTNAQGQLLNFEPPEAKAALVPRRSRSKSRELKPTHDTYDEVALLTPLAGMVRIDIDAVDSAGEPERCVCVLSIEQALALRVALAGAIDAAEAQRKRGV